MRKHAFRAVTAQLISAFVFAIHIVQFRRNFEPVTILSVSTALFVSDLVGKPEVRFSRDAAHF